MKTIHKFPLVEFVRDGQMEFDLPLRVMAETLCVQVDEKTGEPAVWALMNVHPEYGISPRRFRVVATGEHLHPAHEFHGQRAVSLDFWRYVGTWQQAPLVWHLFERQDLPKDR